MSYKADWKSELEKVRSFIKDAPTPVVEETIKTDDQTISEEIDLMLLTDFDEPIVEDAHEESDEDINTKLLEKNMLGRLAKSLELTEDKKSMLFNYFEKGELVQWASINYQKV